MAPPKFGSQADLARFFRVERSTVSRWAAQPRFPKRTKDGYAYAAVIFWLQAFGPHRSERGRDELLQDRIWQLERGDDE